MSLGEQWWTDKVFEIQENQKEAKEKEMRRLLQASEEKEREEEIENAKIVYKRMGFLKFYLCFCLRDRELKKIKQMIQIASALEAEQVDKLEGTGWRMSDAHMYMYYVMWGVHTA